MYTYVHTYLSTHTIHFANTVYAYKQVKCFAIYKARHHYYQFTVIGMKIK